MNTFTVDIQIVINMYMFFVFTVSSAFDITVFRKSGDEIVEKSNRALSGNTPRYNETCSSEENARLCESDCLSKYNTCIGQCQNQGQ